jgi:hypothetical protein
MYRQPFASIPKGVIDVISKKCFNFLRTRKRETNGIPLVKWQELARPKEARGWGIESICFFGRTLAAKCVWRLISEDSLWSRVMVFLNHSNKICLSGPNG